MSCSDEAGNKIRLTAMGHGFIRCFGGSPRSAFAICGCTGATIYEQDVMDKLRLLD